MPASPTGGRGLRSRSSASGIAAAAGGSGLATVEALEAGVLVAMRPVAEAVWTASDGVGALRADVEAMRSEMGELAMVGRGAALQTGAFASWSRGLAASGREVTQAGNDAAARVDEAVASAREANDAMGELAKAGDDIVGVLDTVMAMARQTNLLALNATIESARAGASGRDFAVVADEVQTLSAETGKAAAHIRALIERLRESAGSSIAAVGRVVAVVEDVQPAVGHLRAAADGQAASLLDLAHRAVEASAGVAWVSGRVQEMDALAQGLGTRIADAHGAVAQAEDLTSGFGQRFIAVVRQSEVGDRRRHDRFPADLQVSVRLDGQEFASATLDVGQGGLLLAPTAELDPPVGASLDLEVERLGPVRGQVVATGTAGVHVSFGRLEPELFARVARFVADIEDGYRAAIRVAQQAARRVERSLEQAVADGSLSREDLFDTAYQPIPGSDPPQYETAYLKVFEDVLPAILEPLLLSDSSMVFCNISDRNGYTPVQNRRFAQAQRHGEADWNSAHCLNKRMTDDPAGLIAARSARPFLVQSYARPIGGLTTTIVEVDAPIRLFDRHWGGFRTAYRL